MSTSPDNVLLGRLHRQTKDCFVSNRETRQAKLHAARGESQPSPTGKKTRRHVLTLEEEVEEVRAVVFKKKHEPQRSTARAPHPAVFVPSPPPPPPSRIAFSTAA